MAACWRRRWYGNTIDWLMANTGSLVATMKSLSLLCFILPSAFAFLPRLKNAAETAATTTARNGVSFEEEIGAQPPLGFFDPLGLLKDADAARFNRLRYVELKHGRISMLAVLGHLVTTGNVRLPGNIDYSGTEFASIPSGLAALSKVPTAGLLQIVAFIGFLELAVMKDITGGEFVGDFRNGAFDLGWYVVVCCWRSAMNFERSIAFWK